MAYSFSNAGQSSFGPGGVVSGMNSHAQNGPDLEDIQTEALGFLSLAGDAKVQLLPSSWPTDRLPTPTSSLMSVASQQGLVAAAGPDAVILATTAAVRKAFGGPRTGDSQIRSFQPQLTLPMTLRISQVAFTADENYLILSAEVGGGLAVYEVQSLLKGSTSSAFEMATNSAPLRALVPNPTPEKGELLALVTTDGKLMMANLKEKAFFSGSNGQYLKDNVSCISWSAKGKQLIAGLGDGTAYQLTPEGDGKAEIPRPPTITPDHHVSSISWLENNVFLMIHTPSNFDLASPPQSIFHIVTRQPPSMDHIFQKVTDPASPFGLNRSPPHHFLLRLRAFPPNLQDLIVVASTASTDIGLLSRSKVPLAADKPAAQITGAFTMTEMSDDSRRAQLPMVEGMMDATDTSPIGVAFDLSSQEKVVKPIPTDEMDESSTPLPALMVLNNDGVLASWWIVYSESVRQGSIYPGLVAAGIDKQSFQSGVALQPQTSVFGSRPSLAYPTRAPFGGSINSTPGFVGFNKPAAPAFGAPSSLGGNGISTFGVAPALNKISSPWTVSNAVSPSTGGSTFGTSPVGMTTTPASQGLAFGNSALPGNRVSPWATASTATPAATFGQASGLGVTTGTTSGKSPLRSTFGNIDGPVGAPVTAPFAAFAKQGGFGSVAATGPGSGGSIFASKPAAGGFATPASTSGKDSGRSFGGTASTEAVKSGGLFGAKGFTINSTFKRDDPADKGGLGPGSGTGGPFFGTGFATALTDSRVTSTTTIPEADMDTERPGSLQTARKADAHADLVLSKSADIQNTASTPAAPQFQFPTQVSPVNGGLFGNSDTREATETTGSLKSTGFPFGKPATSDENKRKNSLISEPKSSSDGFIKLEASTLKQETSSDERVTASLINIPEAPLPPDATSKSSYGAGESSVSSIEPDAPLPPDFVFNEASKRTDLSTLLSVSSETKSLVHADLIPSIAVPSGPREEDDSEYETEDDEDHSNGPSDVGSGEDVTQDISPISVLRQTPRFTPPNSVVGAANQSPGVGSFMKSSRTSQDSSRKSLFGEIIGPTAPRLPPPQSLASPRSPSPVRSSIPGRLLRPDASRSVSAPGIASRLLGSRPPARQSTTFSLSLEQKKAEERRNAEAREKREAEESRTLINEEDERVQHSINQDIIATKKLDDFLAHQDYVGDADKDSIPAQVEAVYRDINSMIDTLGVNSYALKCFIKGHTEQYKDPSRTREDLESNDEWCLVEIENLSSIVEKELSKNLEQGRVKDAPDKLETCLELEKDLARLCAKHEDMSVLMASVRDPVYPAVLHSQPLTAEQAAQQHDLRRDFAQLQHFLGKAEEGLTLLRARLASQIVTNGKPTQGPTVEAVMRTVMKMTSMAEKRSGDIDFLENQMRKLRFSSIASVNSQDGSAVATPARKSSTREASTTNTYGLFYTPESVKDTPRAYRASLTSSTHSYNRETQSRKKISGFSEEDKSRLRATAVRRQDVSNKLKAALRKSGARVRVMDHLDGE